MIWGENGYQNLADAIIIQAVKDYRLVASKNSAMAQREKQEIESFFLSDYFKVLTKVNGEKLLSRLQEELL